MKIVFLDRSTVGKVDNIDLLKEFGELTLYETTNSEQTISRTEDADILITNKVIINQKVMDHARNLKLICIAATGMNNVDLEYAQKKNITVKNVSGYSTTSVTQSTFSMILYLLNQSRYYDDYVRSGEYSKSPIFTHLERSFSELKGKVFGIIGMGTIGQSVAKVACAFGCEVIYYSTSGKNQNRTDFRNCTLDELLQSSDIVSIHAPLNENTENLIDAAALKKMKGSAILINTGRGGIVNEFDLANAIDAGTIAAAGVDVLTAEPITQENPLNKVKSRDRLFITPHIAWASMESRTLLIEKIAANIESFLKPG